MLEISSSNWYINGMCRWDFKIQLGLDELMSEALLGWISWLYKEKRKTDLTHIICLAMGCLHHVMIKHRDFYQMMRKYQCLLLNFPASITVAWKNSIFCKVFCYSNIKWNRKEPKSIQILFNQLLVIEDYTHS